MPNFKIGDKVQITVDPFDGEIGRIIEIDPEYEDSYLVDINLGKNKSCVNNYTAEDLILLDDGGLGESKELTFSNTINEEVKIRKERPLNKKLNRSKNEGLKLNEEELKLWLSDHDANFWSQEINESNIVPLRGQHNDIIGTYNFTTNTLKLNESKKSKLREGLYEAAFPSIKGEHCEEIIPNCEVRPADFIEEYVYDYDIHSQNGKFPSWEFIGKIAAAENVSEKSVLDFILECKKYKVFCISAYNYERLVVAAKGVTKEDIYNDYADFLEGNVVVKEVK